jgi:hypothetical protein
VKLDVHVRGKHVAKLYREGDEYLLKYVAGTPDTEFVSLAMPVRDEAWRWPRDLHPANGVPTFGLEDACSLLGLPPNEKYRPTQAYPRYATNPPGLSIEGRKTWAPGKSLETFFKARLGIAPPEYKQMLERLCESAVEVGREMIAAAKNEPRWHDIAKQMLHAWNEGMASVRSARKDTKLKGLTRYIQAAGFSAPTPPEHPEVRRGPR